MIPDEKQIDNYDQSGNDPLSWLFSAEKLIKSASILKNERKKSDLDSIGFFTLAPEIMLRGFAVECLMKGIYVNNGNKLAENGKLLKIKEVGNHRLRQLAHKIGFDLSADEKNLLMRLEVYMTSIGRYPISTTWENTKISNSLGGPPTYWRMPTDDILYAEITRRMADELEELRK